MSSATTDRRMGLTGDKGMKAPVDCATTANITLSGEQTIDGFVTSASRVLVKNQTVSSQNGYYDSSSAAWTRCLDANGYSDLVNGTICLVTGGAQAGGLWRVTTANPITIGTSNLTFALSLTAQSVSAYMATVLVAATAAAARATLAAAASGANSDITSLTALTTPVSLVALRSYLAGCTMSTAGSSATMSIAAGAAMDSTNAYLMQLTAIAKTTSAWAVGTAAGGIDTGAIANSTWYHFYVIRRPDTGVVDVTFSTNATTPTLPANYTQYRRIGSGKTNGSAQWTKFVQVGDVFLWDAAVGDVNTGAQSTTAVLYTLSAPTGVQTEVYYNAITSEAATTGLLFSSPDESDQAPSLAAAPYYSLAAIANANGPSGGEYRTRTNTSAQIRVRATAAIAIFRVATRGWRDSRGRDA